MKMYRCAGIDEHPWGHRDGSVLHVYGTPKEKVGKKSGLKTWMIPRPISPPFLSWRTAPMPGKMLAAPLRRQAWRKTEYVLSLPARCECWGCGDIHVVRPEGGPGQYYGAPPKAGQSD